MKRRTPGDHVKVYEISFVANAILTPSNVYFQGRRQSSLKMVRGAITFWASSATWELTQAVDTMSATSSRMAAGSFSMTRRWLSARTRPRSWVTCTCSGGWTLAE